MRRHHPTAEEAAELVRVIVLGMSGTFTAQQAKLLTSVVVRSVAQLPELEDWRRTVRSHLDDGWRSVSQGYVPHPDLVGVSNALDRVGHLVNQLIAGTRKSVEIEDIAGGTVRDHHYTCFEGDEPTPGTIAAFIYWSCLQPKVLAHT